jgi:hypothetical protein
MNILFLGDIMGRSGREAVEYALPGLKESLEPDVIIVNGENAAHGKGITAKICKGLYELGVDCITTGNHVWDQREIILHIDQDKRLLRPANFPEGTPGAGIYRCTLENGQVIVIANLMARMFMDPLDEPFAAARNILKQYQLGKNADAIFIDFHGETTSEKMALAHMCDGKVSAVIGTHTHIPTADAHILENATAFQTDAGMCGDYDSVIGVRKDIPVARFTKKMPTDRNVPADGAGTVCGVFIRTNNTDGRAVSIDQVILGPHLTNQMPAAQV